jgi:TM2 domain-containing membrane protein YozV
MGDRKNSALAILLSFLWCGTGQIYNGQILKGIILMSIFLSCNMVGIFLGGIGVLQVGISITEEFPQIYNKFSIEKISLSQELTIIILLIAFILLIIGFLTWVYGMINAYKTAEKINKE